jgi:hypothetical protein
MLAALSASLEAHFLRDSPFLANFSKCSLNALMALDCRAGGSPKETRRGSGRATQARPAAGKTRKRQTPRGRRPPSDLDTAILAKPRSIERARQNRGRCVLIKCEVLIRILAAAY